LLKVPIGDLFSRLKRNKNVHPKSPDSNEEEGHDDLVDGEMNV